MSEKVYLFNLKPVTEAKPHVRRARLYRAKLDPHWSQDDQGREYLDITVFENAEPDRFGNTASAVLDTYWRDRAAGAAPEPRGRYVAPTAPPTAPSPNRPKYSETQIPKGSDDLPF